MNITMKKIILSCTLSSVFAFSVYADVTNRVEKSFDVDVSSQFSLDNINGGVEITS